MSPTVFRYKTYRFFKMESSVLGKGISQVEVQNVSPNGVWILVKGTEYFLDYEDYPWFRDALIGDIFDVEIHHDDHLHWPRLEVDLELESLNNPKNYPLIYRG